MSSKVFFHSMKATKKEEALINKIARLCDMGGLADAVAPKDLVAVKLHFGEPGCTTFVPPYQVAPVVDKIIDAGGRPFLTDANTLYVGERSNSVDHTWTALKHGFMPPIVNAPVIIADGLTGKDYVQVQIDKKHFKRVNIASAAVHADALVSVSHFKGHMLSGFGGCIKNVGMGAVASDPQTLIACGNFAC